MTITANRLERLEYLALMVQLRMARNTTAKLETLHERLWLAIDAEERRESEVEENSRENQRELAYRLSRPEEWK